MALSQAECSQEVRSSLLPDRQLRCFQRIYGKAVCDQLQDVSWGHQAETMPGRLKTRVLLWMAAHRDHDWHKQVVGIVMTNTLGLYLLGGLGNTQKGESGEQWPAAMLKLLLQVTQTENFIGLHDTTTSKRGRKYKKESCFPHEFLHFSHSRLC